MQPGQGSGRNGDYYLFRPAGVPGDASMFVDFVAQRAWRGLAASVAFEDMFSCTRSTIGYAENSAGDWDAFAVDAARITDRGLLIEPAGTNYLRNNTNQGQVGTGFPDNWSHALVGGLSVECSSAVEDGLPATDIRIFGTAAGGQSFVAFETNSGVVAALGQTWTFSAFVRLIAAPNPPNAYNLRTREHNGTTVLSNLNQSFAPTGAKQQIVQTVTLASVGVAAIRSGVAIAVTAGQAVDFTLRVSGVQEEQANAPSSPILTSGTAATRAADTVTLDLPAGTHDLTFYFDDSSQIVAGQSGSYVIPTNLNRRVIKSMKAVAV